MKCYITTQYYGGDIDLIEQAAKDCDAQLLAVHGYALKDYPSDRDREYVEGNADYLFLMERDSVRGAYLEIIEGRIRKRLSDYEIPDGYGSYTGKGRKETHGN